MKNTIMEGKPSSSNLALLESVYNSTVAGLERQGEGRCSPLPSWLTWIKLGVLFIICIIIGLVTALTFTCLGGPITTTAAPHANPEHPTSTLEYSTIEPSTIEPSTIEPSTLEPNTLEPSTLEPSTIEPSTLEPSTHEPSTLEPSTLELIWNTSDTALEDMDPALQQRINYEFRRQEEELKKTEECRPVLVNVTVKSLLSPHDSLLDEFYLKPENVAIYQCSGCNVGGCTGEKEGWSGVCAGDGLCGLINVNETTDRLANIPLTKTLFLKTIYQGKIHVHQREVKQHNHCGCRHH